MGIVLWIIFGAVVGWIASALMKSPNGILSDIILGIIGAVIGGFIMNLLGASGVTGFNLYSLIIAIVGSVIVIWLGRIFYHRAV